MNLNTTISLPCSARPTKRMQEWPQCPLIPKIMTIPEIIKLFSVNVDFLILNFIKFNFPRGREF
jgi:hypothetical protein